MFFTSDLIFQAQKILAQAKKKQLKIATAESCTGGLISSLLTENSGSSEVFECSFVTYSNEAKNKILGVKNQLLKKFGAVSPEVAREMAIGARQVSGADLSIAVTGVAGPNGGSSEKPVGLVYIASAKNNRVTVRKFNFSGDRKEIRKSSIISALLMLERAI